MAMTVSHTMSASFSAGTRFSSLETLSDQHVMRRYRVVTARVEQSVTNVAYRVWAVGLPHCGIS